MFFVDEIHRLPRALEETFYPAMEDRWLPITVGQGAGARVVTLAASAVHADRRDDPGGADHHAPARALRHPGTASSLPAPRTWRRSSSRSAGILERRRSRRGRARDRGAQPGHAARRQPAAQARARLRRGARATGSSAPARRAEALELLEVDDAGLDRLDREILRAICEKFGGGPVGLSTLAVAVGEEQDTIEDVYEPYLLQRGLIKRTPRGRAATAARLRAPRTRTAGSVESLPSAGVEGGACLAEHADSGDPDGCKAPVEPRVDELVSRGRLR